MGILRHITEQIEGRLSNESALTFVQWCISNRISRASLLTKNQDRFKISASFNMNFESIQLGDSSVDFWDSTKLLGNSSYIITDDDMDFGKYLQFFGGESKFLFTKIIIYTFATKKIIHDILIIPLLDDEIFPAEINSLPIFKRITNSTSHGKFFLNVDKSPFVNKIFLRQLIETIDLLCISKKEFCYDSITKDIFLSGEIDEENLIQLNYTTRCLLEKFLEIDNNEVWKFSLLNQQAEI